ncbi:MAG: hypothetical protein Q8K67_07805 [Geothrix sp.]|nr:hypothetical protein [Geothrix sp.]
MATHHPFHLHPQVPLRRFTLEHPYAADWLLLTVGTVAALLLWFWNS